MSANVGKTDFNFDCIVERPRAALGGGRYAIVVTLLLLIIAIAAIFPFTRSGPQEAGAPAAVAVA